MPQTKAIVTLETYEVNLEAIGVETRRCIRLWAIRSLPRDLRGPWSTLEHLGNPRNMPKGRPGTLRVVPEAQGGSRNASSLLLGPGKCRESSGKARQGWNRFQVPGNCLYNYFYTVYKAGHFVVFSFRSLYPFPIDLAVAAVHRSVGLWIEYKCALEICL